MIAQNTTFGIEIEMLVPVAHSIERGGYHNGRQIEGFPAGWNAQADSSVQTEDGYQAVEVVSPKLRGMDGLVQIVTVCDRMKALGAKVNQSCGLHVHIDGKELNGNDVSRLIFLFRKYEVVFYALNGRRAEERYNNGYCPNSTRWNMSAVFTNRYQSLNLRNWASRARNASKTVEFRLFSATLEAEEVVQAVYMCMSLVIKAKEGSTVNRTLGQSLTAKVQSFIDKVLNNEAGHIVPGVTSDLGDILLEQAEQVTLLA